MEQIKRAETQIGGGAVIPPAGKFSDLAILMPHFIQFPSVFGLFPVVLILFTNNAPFIVRLSRRVTKKNYIQKYILEGR